MKKGDTHFQDYHSNVVVDEGKKNITLKIVKEKIQHTILLNLQLC